MRLLVLLALTLASCTAADVAPGRQATYTNPVLDEDFPDPAVLRARDGWYYAYATQSEKEGRTLNIQVARSRDLVRWTRVGDALPVKPGWASRTQDFWAPHVAEHDGRYYLYYSAKPDAALDDPSQGLCLAVATADRPEGPFTDSGRPLQCGPTFVNIDPMAFDDPRTGRRLLYWGSGFGPIKVRALARDRLSFEPGTDAVPLVHPMASDDPREYRRLIEGAWVIYRAPWYYLFFSGDDCCGEKAHYAVMVARSRRATGPFEVRGNGVILERQGKWIAPGHNSVITDRRGQDWIVYHAVDANRPRARESDRINTRRVMLIDRIVYRGGWPVVEGPSEEPRAAPGSAR